MSRSGDLPSGGRVPGCWPPATLAGDRAATWPETKNALTPAGLRVSLMSYSSSRGPGATPRLICGLDCFGSGLDELDYIAGVGDHRHVARWDLNGGGTHPFGELALGVGRDRVIVLSDQVPGW